MLITLGHSGLPARHGQGEAELQLHRALVHQALAGGLPQRHQAKVHLPSPICVQAFRALQLQLWEAPLRDLRSCKMWWHFNAARKTTTESAPAALYAVKARWSQCIAALIGISSSSSSSHLEVGYI